MWGIYFAVNQVSYMKYLGGKMKKAIPFLCLIVLSLMSETDKIVTEEIPIQLESLRKQETVSERDINCIVENAFHEARGEGLYGMLLVTQVVLNRSDYRNNFCEVVYKHKQFSWTDKKVKKVPKEFKIKIKPILMKLVNYEIAIHNKYSNAYFYHSVEIKPKWSKKVKYIGTYKNHKFYEK